MDHQTQAQEKIEAAVFRKLVSHLQARTDVQNIELMNLAGFCRNCLSKWYVAASAEVGSSVAYEDARDLVYGMKYQEWKARHQTEATPDQREQFEARSSNH